MRYKTWRRLRSLIYWAVLALLWVLLLCCCRSRQVSYVAMPSSSVSAQWRDGGRLRADTLHVTDSIREVVRGDTVIRERWRTSTAVRMLTDTVREVRRDSVMVSVAVPVEVVREVSRELRWWQRVLMWAGGVSLVFIAAFTGWMLWRVRH